MVKTSRASWAGERRSGGGNFVIRASSFASEVWGNGGRVVFEMTSSAWRDSVANWVERMRLRSFVNRG